MHRFLTLAICVLIIITGEALIAQDFDNYKTHSLYTDFKAKMVGDIITIMIIESTSGAGQSDNKSADQASLKANGGVTGNLTSFLPILGASSDFATDNSAKSSSAQKDVLTGKLTAIVTEILPNGNLVLQGKRKLEVSGETYVLQVKGMVRQKDITAENIVYSFNLANVEISYKKGGLVNSLGKPPFLARWSTWLMAAGLGAAAYLGISAAQSAGENGG